MDINFGTIEISQVKDKANEI